MDLRSRLNLVVVLMMLLIASAGVIFSVLNARQSVKREVDTSIRTVSNMLDIGLQDVYAKQHPGDYLSHLIDQIEQQRHIHIHVNPAINTSVSAQSSQNQLPETQQTPPWFGNLVRPEPQSQSRKVQINDHIYQITLRDNPDDEINEAWGEAQGLFYLLALQSLLVWVLCHFILGQALKPLPTLLTGLRRIESGNYNTYLAECSLPEYKQITDAFNHAMTSLQIKTAENRLLTQHSLNLQEQERQTLARELHDELAQSLTGIKAVASSIQMAYPQSKQAVESILSICDDLFLVVRSMMRRLRPCSLDELGLAASLQELVSDWQQLNPACQITLNLDLKHEVQNSDASIHLFRIVQESLNNISRHSHASLAEIKLQTTQHGSLELTISDNGIGFENNSKAKGFGLLGIRERVETLNGILQIDSQSEHGTRLVVSVPIPS
ncbi:MAG TPA: sensor histidine kinase [Crenotrichaceae bacterium]|nr:sensor histidine kinase [Crenotrichaceae bacterium]